MVNAAAAQPGAFFIAAGGGHHGAALHLGHLRHNRTDRAGRAGHKHRVPRLRLADFQQAGITRQPRHAQHTQKGTGRNAGQARQFFQRGGRRHIGFAPAEHGIDQITGREIRAVAGHHFTHGAALQRLANLERRDIAGPVIHAAAHIGVNAHEQVLHQHFADAGGWQGHAGHGKMFGSGHANGPGGQADFTGLGHGKGPFDMPTLSGRRWPAKRVEVRGGGDGCALPDVAGRRRTPPDAAGQCRSTGRAGDGGAQMAIKSLFYMSFFEQSCPQGAIPRRFRNSSRVFHTCTSSPVAAWVAPG